MDSKIKKMENKIVQLDIASKPIKSEGYLLPWDKSMDQPAFIEISGVIFIPLFSDEEKLNKHLEFTKYGFEVGIKKVIDTDDFLDSVKPYRVALDARPTERGTTRFTEIIGNHVK